MMLFTIIFWFFMSVGAFFIVKKFLNNVLLQEEDEISAFILVMTWLISFLFWYLILPGYIIFKLISDKKEN